ncbi:MAG: DUF3108 domain-containing protein [Pseudomonadales bacterium]|nr:DUF3108 domain-containing protein [Pseudomonadales bacterium]
MPTSVLHRLFSTAMIGALLFLTSTVSLASTTPSETTSPLSLTPYEASFSASLDKGVAIDGGATRTLRQLDSGLWHYDFRVSSFIANITESVIFRWQDHRVIPLRYRYHLSGMLIRDRERLIDFNWQDGVVSGRYEGKTFELPLRPGSLDPLGYQLQLHQDLRAGLTDVTYQVVDKGRYDEDRFQVIRQEPLQTELGEVETLVVEKVRGEGSGRETLMWFAPQWQHLLVRLTQKEPDGSRYQIHLEDMDLSERPTPP